MNLVTYRLFIIIFHLLVIDFFSFGQDYPLIDEKEYNSAIDYIVLPKKLKENSGIIYYNDKIWTFNDSGGKSELYALNTETGKIVQTIHLKKAINIDWEDIAQDSDYIYIGDIGNTAGIRLHFVIYKIPKNLIPENKDTSIQPQIIRYTYPDQKKRTLSKNNIQFDCEAIIIFNDSIYLFTKDWKLFTSRVYNIPAAPGSYQANYLGQLPISGLITGADINPKNQKVVFCGRNHQYPFILIMNDFNLDFSSSKIKYISMPLLHNSQIEGICFTPHNKLFLSSEKNFYPPRLFYINMKSLKSN